MVPVCWRVDDLTPQLPCTQTVDPGRAPPVRSPTDRKSPQPLKDPVLGGGGFPQRGGDNSWLGEAPPLLPRVAGRVWGVCHLPQVGPPSPPPPPSAPLPQGTQFPAPAWEAPPGPGRVTEDATCHLPLKRGSTLWPPLSGLSLFSMKESTDNKMIIVTLQDTTLQHIPMCAFMITHPHLTSMFL